MAMPLRHQAHPSSDDAHTPLLQLPPTSDNHPLGFFPPFLHKLCQPIKEDPRKLIHSLKMASALTLSLLLVLLKFPYQQFGSHAIWAVMTVVVVFEFTVGATLSKGLNRGLGTLTAGLLATAIAQSAEMSGDVFRPVLIGVTVFLTGGIVTYAKLWPMMKLYEVGFRTFLVTFCLIIATSYQDGEPVKTAVDRFIVIALGAAIGLVINLFFFPIWSGDELHEFISQNFDSVADSLEECVHQYLRGVTLERCPTKIIMGQTADDPVYKGYRAALISASKEESLANFAVWEPPHGRFKMLRYPWMEYVKVGAVLRHCTYSVVALHGCLRSKIQAPVAVRRIFEDEFREISTEAAKVLRVLGMQVHDMHRGRSEDTLRSVYKATSRLQENLYLRSYYLVKAGDNISEDEDLSKNVALASTGFISECHNMLASAHPKEENKRKGQPYKKLLSWPIRSEIACSATNSAIEHRVRKLESASALSLGTFASLLIEVVARLDYVVHAVEDLSQLAKFKNTDIVK